MKKLVPVVLALGFASAIPATAAPGALTTGFGPPVPGQSAPATAPKIILAQRRGGLRMGERTARSANFVASHLAPIRFAAAVPPPQWLPS